MNTKGYVLNFDDMDDSFVYTEYDIGGYGHSALIKEENRELFLDAYARIQRERAEKYLEECMITEDGFLADDEEDDNG